MLELSLQPLITTIDESSTQLQPQFLTRKETGKILTCGMTKLWDMTQKGIIPPPISIGGYSKRYIASEIQLTINSIIAGADNDALRELTRGIVSSRNKTPSKTAN